MPSHEEQLKSLLQQEAPARLIVTGNIGQGKTTWCQGLIGAARASGLKMGGLLSPPVFEDGVKIGIDLVNLYSNETRRLAVRRTPTNEGVLTHNWAFDPEVLAWGDTILASVPAVDVLVIDELGPLEFERGEGWQHGLSAFDKGDYRIGIVVVRPWLLDTALARWPHAQTFHI